MVKNHNCLDVPLKCRMQIFEKYWIDFKKNFKVFVKSKLGRKTCYLLYYKHDKLLDINFKKIFRGT